MNIQSEKISLVQLLLQTEDIKIIEKVKAIFKNDKNDWWDELSVEQKFEIEAGIKDADEGKVVSFEVFMEKYL